jgi:chemotaxis family two-component system sensor kinase Cph1
VLLAVELIEINGESCALSIVRDITERKLAEEARARLINLVEIKNKELQQVVFVASHDLRSPLVNADGYSRELVHAIEDLQGALNNGKPSPEGLITIAQILDEEMPEALRFIRASVSKMDILLKGLLTLSRTGSAELTIKPLDMDQLLSAVNDSAEFQIKDLGAQVDISALPPCKGDPLQVNQVFSNLLGNALKYHDPERPLKIQITGQVERDRSIYCVQDSGLGIAPAHQENVFELFHRLNPNDCEGEGLGLTIIQQVLSRLSGEIWLESELGKGSKFYVALPTV